MILMDVFSVNQPDAMLIPAAGETRADDLAAGTDEAAGSSENSSNNRRRGFGGT